MVAKTGLAVLLTSSYNIILIFYVNNALKDKNSSHTVVPISKLDKRSRNDVTVSFVTKILKM